MVRWALLVRELKNSEDERTWLVSDGAEFARWLRVSACGKLDVLGK